MKFPFSTEKQTRLIVSIPSAAPDPETLRRQVAESQRAYVRDLLERLAKEAEPLAMTRRDELLSAAIAEHERDVAGFEFKCDRWGSFVTINTARRGNGEDWCWLSLKDKMAPKEFSTSLNIANCGAIQLLSGSLADDQGELAYGYVIEADDHSGTILGGTGMDCLPQPGYHHEVRPQYPRIPSARRLFKMEAPKTRDYEGACHVIESYQIKYKTKPYPRAAVDDRIKFFGLNATLFIPAGLGAAVLQQILLATA